MRKREGVEPRNMTCCNGIRVFKCLKSELAYALNGEYMSACRGRSPWRASEKGRYRNLGEPKRSSKAVEKRLKRDDAV